MERGQYLRKLLREPRGLTGGSVEPWQGGALRAAPLPGAVLHWPQNAVRGSLSFSM